MAKVFFAQSLPSSAQRLLPNPVRHVFHRCRCTDGLVVAIQSRVVNGVEEIVGSPRYS
jgi:hypothetical protein